MADRSNTGLGAIQSAAAWRNGCTGHRDASLGAHGRVHRRPAPRASGSTVRCLEQPQECARRCPRPALHAEGCAMASGPFLGLKLGFADVPQRPCDRNSRAIVRRQRRRSPILGRSVRRAASSALGRRDRTDAIHNPPQVAGSRHPPQLGSRTGGCCQPSVVLSSALVDSPAGPPLLVVGTVL